MWYKFKNNYRNFDTFHRNNRKIHSTFSREVQKILQITDYSFSGEGGQEGVKSEVLRVKNENKRGGLEFRIDI